MFQGMGIQYAATLLGCVALVLVPVPVWFFYKGAEIRQKSPFAPTAKPATSEE
jgi:DHA1 family multidrug resistance protein-like MFS transporter